MEKKKIIRCPFCGAEYVAEEIFYPQEVFNNEIKVIKDENNHVLIISNGDSLNFKEEYECDHCGHKFEVKGEVKFTTKLLDKEIFEEEYSVKL